MNKIQIKDIDSSHMCHACATVIIPRVNELIAAVETLQKARATPKAAPKKSAAKKAV